MAEINYKHLRYFWMVAKIGSISKASEKLCITPQSISAQLSELEGNLDCVLFRKVGRGLELTKYGREIFKYAEEIFSIGNELSSFIDKRKSPNKETLRIGITDSLPKSVALNLIEPIFEEDLNIILYCSQGKLNDLLSDLSINRIDAIISDRKIEDKPNFNVFNHNLGESKLAIYGTKQLIETQRNATFPELLRNANFLMPGNRFQYKDRLIKWLDTHNINPLVVAEFDDSALMKLFGQKGYGFFIASYSLKDFICSNYQVELAGVIDTVFEEIYAITTNRRINHPGILRIIKSRDYDSVST